MDKLAGRRACPVVFQQRGASGNVVALSLHVCDVVDLAITSDVSAVRMSRNSARTSTPITHMHATVLMKL